MFDWLAISLNHPSSGVTERVLATRLPGGVGVGMTNKTMKTVKSGAVDNRTIAIFNRCLAIVARNHIADTYFKVSRAYETDSQWEENLLARRRKRGLVNSGLHHSLIKEVKAAV